MGPHGNEYLSARDFLSKRLPLPYGTGSAASEDMHFGPAPSSIIAAEQESPLQGKFRLQPVLRVVLRNTGCNENSPCRGLSGWQRA